MPEVFFAVGRHSAGSVVHLTIYIAQFECEHHNLKMIEQ